MRAFETLEPGQSTRLEGRMVGDGPERRGWSGELCIRGALLGRRMNL
jgi:hypothetical protein